MASYSYRKSSLPLLTSLVLASIAGCHQLSVVGERLPQEQHAGAGREYVRDWPAAKIAGQIPDGVADPAKNIVYVRNDKNGIDALHLETGKLLWRTNEGALPLLADKHLLALAPSEKGQVPYVLDPTQPYKPWQDVKYRFVLLDTQQKGKRVWQSEPVASYDTGEGQASESRVWAWKEGDRLFFRYWSSAGYGGGMVPSEDMLIPRLHATVGEIQLDSGKFKILSELNGLARSPRGLFLPTLQGAPVEPEPGPPPLALTRENAQVYESGEKAFQTEVFQRGNRAITLSYQPGREGGLLIWNSADLAGERKDPSRVLFKGKMSFVVLPRSPHLFVKHDTDCWIFDLESGKQIGLCYTYPQSEWPAVVGDRLFFVANGDILYDRGMIPRQLVCCSIRGGRAIWRHPLLPSPWSPPPP